MFFLLQYSIVLFNIQPLQVDAPTSNFDVDSETSPFFWKNRNTSFEVQPCINSLRFRFLPQTKVRFLSENTKKVGIENDHGIHKCDI